MNPPAGDRWVTLAVLGKTRGNRGELTAFPYSSTERCRSLNEVFLFVPGSAAPIRGNVESVWEHGERLIFKFKGVDSISEAERLQGAEIRLPFAERPEAAPGEYYRSDLIGCQVVEQEGGKVLGCVTGWQDTGGAPLLEVDDLLIPFAASICVLVDPQARRIVVQLPEGLKDLSRS